MHKGLEKTENLMSIILSIQNSVNKETADYCIGVINWLTNAKTKVVQDGQDRLNAAYTIKLVADTKDNKLTKSAAEFIEETFGYEICNLQYDVVRKILKANPSALEKSMNVIEKHQLAQEIPISLGTTADNLGDMVEEVAKMYENDFSEGLNAQMGFALNATARKGDKEKLKQTIDLLRSFFDSYHLNRISFSIGRTANYANADIFQQLLGFYDTYCYFDYLNDCANTIGECVFNDNVFNKKLLDFQEKLIEREKHFVDDNDYEQISVCMEANMAITRTQEKSNNETTMEIIDLLDRFLYKECKIIAEAVSSVATNDYDVGLFKKIIDKYSKEYLYICELVESELIKKNTIYLDGFLEEDVYKSITESSNSVKIIHEVLTKENNDYCNQIGIQVGLLDYELVNNTIKFVRGIHNERSTEDIKKISEVFYSELRRAVNQGKDLKEKQQYLRSYCKEVMEKIKENALELMFHA